MRTALPLLLAALLAACASRAPQPPAPPPAPVANPEDERRGADVVVAAMAFLDTPYRRGGSSAEQGFDCSGFTRHVFSQTLGMSLPRRAEDQALARELRDVGRAALVPGDLVFFNTLQRSFSHVGIYIGDGRFIHAPRSGAAVRLENMRMAYWASRFNGARRPWLAAADNPTPNTPTLNSQ